MASKCIDTFVEFPFVTNKQEHRSSNQKMVSINSKLIKLYFFVTEVKGNVSRLEKHGCKTLVPVETSGHVSNEM